MGLSQGDKAVIQVLAAEKGYGARRLLREFPDRGWKHSTVADFLKKVRETGSGDRRPGSERPRTARTDENIATVSELICSDED